MTNTTVKITKSTRAYLSALGSELVYNEGIRAIAASKAIERGITNLDALYDACLIDVGEICVTTDVDNESGEVIKDTGKNALRRYLALYELFGPDWLAVALEMYFEHFTHYAAPDDLQLAAYECLTRAQTHYREFKARDVDAVRRWLIKVQGDLGLFDKLAA